MSETDVSIEGTRIASHMGDVILESETVHEGETIPLITMFVPKPVVKEEATA